ncbi:MAG: DUF3800 domain-containing protein [Bacteroidales bacterium]|jgi:hypothetical protein|nr:DUF3800 domain-containing protein [Bacteroidales bacterium]
MALNIYLDESGDLGWIFDKPYRKGGSSRFLTIAYIICPSEKKHFIKRIIKKLYSKLHIPTTEEIKGSSLSVENKIYVANKTMDLLKNHPDIIIGHITVSKERVQKHIREDANKLYNYMLKLSILPKIEKHPIVNLIRDNKSIKVKSGNSLIDYLQTTMWFEHNSSTKIIDLPSDSRNVNNLIFIDWINNIVWGNYEDRNKSAFEILIPKMEIQTLFF